MLIVLATHPDLLGPRRLVFAGGEVTISAGVDDDVVLAPGPQGHRICRVFVDADRDPMMTDLSSKVPVHAHGRRIGSQTWVGEPSIVRIRSFLFQFRNGAVGDSVGAHAPYVASHPTERGLLEALVGGDPASRAVYADWLEERGDPVRAELLRVQEELLEMKPGKPDHVGHTARLAALAAQVDVGWRVQVARSAIERCTYEFEFRCPKTWSQLQPTGRAEVRHCTMCQRDVHYALGISEARRHAAAGHCVALDVTSGRWPEDLAARAAASCEACGMEHGAAYRGPGCAHCGHRRRAERVVPVVVVGRINRG